jgi:hypothetical protein
MDDNHKFTIKDYRDAIYADISKKRKEKLQKKYLEKIGVNPDIIDNPKPQQPNSSSTNVNTTQSTNTSVVQNNSMIQNSSVSQNSSMVQSKNSSVYQQPTQTNSQTQQQQVQQAPFHTKATSSGIPKQAVIDKEDKEKVLQEKKQNYTSSKPQTSGTVTGGSINQVPSSNYYHVSPTMNANANNNYYKPSGNKQTTVGSNQSIGYSNSNTNSGNNSNMKNPLLGQYNNNYFHQASYQPNGQSSSNGQARPSSQGYMGPYGKVPSNGSGALIKKK